MFYLFLFLLFYKMIIPKLHLKLIIYQLYFTRRMPLVEQKLLSLPKHLSSPRFLVGFVLLDFRFYVYVL